MLRISRLMKNVPPEGILTDIASDHPIGLEKMLNDVLHADVNMIKTNCTLRSRKLKYFPSSARSISIVESNP